MLTMLMSILKIAKNLLQKILPQPGFEPGISRLATRKNNYSTIIKFNEHQYYLI